ncbi:MAG: nitroreductase/quinone reductase family protein [Anaerolineae bacterium]
MKRDSFSIYKIWNPIAIRLLRSPLHGAMSRNTLLITYRGRKSGRSYTVPVNYARDGSDLLILTAHEKTWWRSLIGGAPVTLHVRGVEHKAQAEAYPPDDERMLPAFQQMAALIKPLRRAFNLTLDDDGSVPADEATRAAADGKVMIRVTDVPQS